MEKYMNIYTYMYVCIYTWQNTCVRPYILAYIAACAANYL